MVAKDGTQNILDAISDTCKIIFPSTHVVYEGLEKVQNEILEDEGLKPILSYSNSKALNEKQLKNSKIV
jgi:nucleoside-diphosphate-sugar epimerase